MIAAVCVISRASRLRPERFVRSALRVNANSVHEGTMAADATVGLMRTACSSFEVRRTARTLIASEREIQ